MCMKTMMVGCVAGEAQLDDGSDAERAANAELLAREIEKHALALRARLIVLKEFPSSYRGTLACFERRGFTRIPSMPLTRLNIAYRSFDEYMQSALNSATRSKLRKKFKATAGDVPIELHVNNDIRPDIDEVYPPVPQCLSTFKAALRKADERLFLSTGSDHARAGAVLRLASQRQGRGIWRVPRPRRHDVCGVFGSRVRRRS